jgi:hypothetical protein
MQMQAIRSVLNFFGDSFGHIVKTSNLELAENQ